VAWPQDDGTDDLAALVDAVRAGRWIRNPREAKESLCFVAGFVAAKRDATFDEIESALRACGCGRLAWHASRVAIERPSRRRLLGTGVA